MNSKASKCVSAEFEQTLSSCVLGLDYLPSQKLTYETRPDEKTNDAPRSLSPAAVCNECCSTAKYGRRLGTTQSMHCRDELPVSSQTASCTGKQSKNIKKAKYWYTHSRTTRPRTLTKKLGKVEEKVPQVSKSSKNSVWGLTKLKIPYIGKKVQRWQAQCANGVSWDPPCAQNFVINSLRR